MKSFLFLLFDHFKYTIKLLFSPLNKFFTSIGTIRPNLFHHILVLLIVIPILQTIILSFFSKKPESCLIFVLGSELGGLSQ